MIHLLITKWAIVFFVWYIINLGTVSYSIEKGKVYPRLYIFMSMYFPLFIITVIGCIIHLIKIMYKNESKDN